MENLGNQGENLPVVEGALGALGAPVANPTTPPTPLNTVHSKRVEELALAPPICSP